MAKKFSELLVITLLKGIQQPNPRPHEVIHVTCDYREIMNQCARCNQLIQSIFCMKHAQVSSQLSNFFVYRQDVLGVAAQKSRKPRFEKSGLLYIAPVMD